MKLLGLHHITCITSDSNKIFFLFTKILGMKLIKKTVNQDDVSAYHLFFSDAKGNPGTDVTFFDFKNIQNKIDGTDCIYKIGLKVPSLGALVYFKKRIHRFGFEVSEIKQLHDMTYFNFYDFDNQKYAVYSNENHKNDLNEFPNKTNDIPFEFAITSLGPISFYASNLDQMNNVLEKYLGFKLIKKIKETNIYSLPLDKLNSRIIVKQKHGMRHIQGSGSVHHVAFSINDDNDLYNWINKLNQIPSRHSGFVDRFYFHSLYTRLYPGILFEFATLGPGFIDDEECESELGTKLSLPPFLRPYRSKIENNLKPLQLKEDE